jgi:circadian clock protein KaiC
MTKPSPANRIETGVRSFDDLLGGGLPTGTITVLAGPPGSGKTILSQQIGFFNAARGKRVLCFNTLSEPTAKTLRYLRQFDYFDQATLDASVRFVDLGRIAREKGLASALELIVEQVRAFKPAIVVIDSFRVFDDLAGSPEELRKFAYEVAVRLMAWETTAFLLGEYSASDVESSPLFSIVDGMILLTQREVFGEHHRSIRIVKMRGAAHRADANVFSISSAGIEIYSPETTIRRLPYDAREPVERRRTHMKGLDALLGSGVPAGSTLLVSGVAGTGKTALLVEFVYRGALAGEKGVLFSYEETGERIRAFARAFGWDLDAQIAAGMVEIVFVPQPEISVERHLIMVHDKVKALGARRLAIDSVSVFLHKVRDAQISRERMFQLGSVVHNARAIGLFATDIPYGANRISRLGVEETVVDGIVLLTSVEEQLQRQRYIEIYKLRNTAHLSGRHAMQLGPRGVEIFPRYAEARGHEPPPALAPSRRLQTGVPGLDPLVGGGVLERSVTLVAGGAGTGKTTLAVQFALAGVAQGHHSLYVSLEEGPAQLAASAKALGLPLERAMKSGKLEVVYLTGELIRPPELFALLTDKVRQQNARRVIVDAISDLPAGKGMHERLKPLVARLGQQFKRLGATTLLTLEATARTADEAIAGLSPIADNVLVLRYADRDGEREPTLTVLKTRGSRSSRATHVVHIGRGGATIEEAIKPRRTTR